MRDLMFVQGMGRREFGVLAVLFTLLAVPARATVALDACMEKAKTQHELHVCASEEAGRVERDRTALLQRVLKAAEGDDQAVRKINASERAWLAYRAAFLEAMHELRQRLGVFAGLEDGGQHIGVAKV